MNNFSKRLKENPIDIDFIYNIYISELLSISPINHPKKFPVVIGHWVKKYTKFDFKINKIYVYFPARGAMTKRSQMIYREKSKIIYLPLLIYLYI